MNLKTWFKGLGVFVASSLVTSLAAANLSPSTFNFSKQGLTKLGALAMIVGIKAVLLYLKQSPLPSPDGKTNWTRISSMTAFAAVLPAALLASGCVSSWEQTTYATLATGKALIDCAVAGYNHFDADIRNACSAKPGDAAFDPRTFYIPQTRDAQQAIEKARQAQTGCVEAFEAYAVAKVGKDTTVSLADKEAAVTGYLTQLPTLLNAVRALIGKPAASALPFVPSTPPSLEKVLPAGRRDAIAGLARLNPVEDLLRSPDLSRLAVDRGDHPITRFLPEVSHGQ
jgi:hypothetical protein